MTRHFVRFVAGPLVLAALAACGGGGGGGDGTTPPAQVASVVITSPGVGPTFATLGRTAQFAAEARSSSGAAISGVTISWSSSDNTVASVSGSGLVTAVANGAAQIRASASGVQSGAVTVTVAQVANSVAITPGSVQFGAIGSTRQLAAAVKDSGNAVIPGATVTWSRAGPGTVASVNAAGLVTAVANGTGDSAVATSGTASAKAPITVSQVVANIVVSAPAGDSVLRTTGRTRQFTATARDSNNNTVAGATVTWSSNSTSVATVGSSSGLVTAGSSDGSATIQATASGVTGSRVQVVQHYAATFTLSAPGGTTISTQGGNVTLNGTAQDSASTNLSIGWVSRSTTVATVSPASGTSPSTATVTAVGNGTSYVVMSAGTRRDSALITASGQSGAPTSISVDIGDNFFKSVRNSTQNPAVDTVATGGTVTWTWVGSNPHGVGSTGSPSFTSSTIQTGAGHMYQFTFTAAGTYTYDCLFHGTLMTGRIVVQ